MFIESKLVEEILLRQRNRSGFAVAERAMNTSVVYKHLAPNGALTAERSPNFD
jgi:hypothetical protein